MKNYFLFTLILFAVVSCGQRGHKNACQTGLNMEKFFDDLRYLPESYQIREVTQNFSSTTSDGVSTHLPRNIYVQDRKSKYLEQSWIGRQSFVQNCQTNTVTTDGYVWSIKSADPTELDLSFTGPALIKMKFKKLTNNSLIIEQTSTSATLQYFVQKIIFRWGAHLPNTEMLDSNFVLGLYEDGLNLPEKIVEQFGDKLPDAIEIGIDDLIGLQKQITKPTK